jgi:hypothetical protein
VLALVCWALTAILGVRDVAVNGKVLATLLVAEIILVVVFSFADLFSPNFHPSSAPVDPGQPGRHRLRRAARHGDHRLRRLRAVRGVLRGVPRPAAHRGPGPPTSRSR